MPLVYHPISGMGFNVEPSDVKGYLARGFRSQAPIINPVVVLPNSDDDSQEEELVRIPEPTNPIQLNRPKLMAVASPEIPPSSAIVNVNNATLKELTSLPKVGTAIARKVVENRPYQNIEDLIAKVEISGSNWIDLEHQICF